MKRVFIQLCIVGFTLCHASAQPALPGAAPNNLPYPPMPASPVAVFRMLLATNEEGRTQWIAKWKPAQRGVLEGKIAEFKKLSPAEREIRLQTLELRWYLPQLMMMNFAERTARLATIPEPERTLLTSKLKTWDIQPPEIKEDLMEYQQVIGVVMFPSAGSTNDNVLRGLPRERQEELNRQFEHLNALPDERRERVLADFQRYFEFSPGEKIKAMKRLTETQQVQLQQRLAPFEILPPAVRQQALAGFNKFAELSPPERAAFLQSAERWQKMNEAEREKWRQLAARLQKARALIPPPPMPPAIARPPGTALVGTN